MTDNLKDMFDVSIPSHNQKTGSGAGVENGNLYVACCQACTVVSSWNKVVMQCCVIWQRM